MFPGNLVTLSGKEASSLLLWELPSISEKVLIAKKRKETGPQSAGGSKINRN